jgi:hypothetical protein
MTKFEIGKTYWTRSAFDHECIYEITVVSRTAQTIKTACGKTLRAKPTRWSPTVEQVKPHGTYSMCAVITAEDCGPIPARA